MRAKLVNEEIIVLYPGSFKPVHSGHLSLIKKYANYPGVKEVRVLVGPGIRNGIDQKTATEILEKLMIDQQNVKIESVPWPSPVLASYKILQESIGGTYALAASSKEAENSERIKSFVFKHSPEGKFYRPEIKVIELNLDINPLNFSGRTDEYEGGPISASALRNDIINEDFKNFSSGYPNLEKEKINFIWNSLHEIVTGTTTSKSYFDNYGGSQPGYAYRNMFPIAEEGEKDENKKPSYFTSTHYRLPSEEELKEINSFNLSDEELLQGFQYNMVGKGILDMDKKEKIIQASKKLSDMYPDNETYKKVLEKAKKITGRHITK
jgi:hypothetical protein